MATPVQTPDRDANTTGFLEDLISDLKPLSRHTIVVLFLFVCALVLGFATHGLGYALPEHADVVVAMSTIDGLVVYALVSMYGAYLLLTVGIISVRGVRRMLGI